MGEMTVNDALRMALGFHKQGNVAAAEEIYQQVVEQAPHNADALHLLGIVRQQQGRQFEAVELFERALALDPSLGEACYNLGNSLLFLGRDEEAETAFERAVTATPKFAEAWNNLGRMRMAGSRPRPRAASEAYATAIRHRPQLAEAHNGLGIALKDLGRVAEAIASFRKAIELKPSYADAHSNLVYTLPFDPAYDAAAILAEAVAWSRRHADALTAAATPHAPDRSPDRRLRVGYVSPDLREHPVGLSMLPIVPNHDREAFEIVCFSDATNSDHVTAALRAAAAEWPDTHSLSDAKLAELIRERKIDILIDLTMHMNNNRLLTFARRPAPVQANFAAYPATSGVRAIDYRITDAFLDPPGETEQFNTETLLRLPHSFWCYPDLANSPPVGPLPAERNGYVTFGSLNNPCKVSEPAMELWRAVLDAVPGSRLILSSLDESPPRPADERIELVGKLPRGEYLRVYDRIDIALDPLPYNGHFTSCDALFMGVPVVSLRGTTSVGRAGESVLTALSMTELLAKSPQEFVTIAAELARDLPRLAQIRRTLRDRMRASPLMDGVGFTKALESLYRSMWRSWCGS